MSLIRSIYDIVNLAFDYPNSHWEKYGRVTVKQSGDLLLFSYKAEAQYGDEWNFFELVSRGLIINRRTRVVEARPFDKFFNYGERGRFPGGKVKRVYEKMDGSLGILYRDNGQFKIATRGSFDSEQAIWATEYLNANYKLNRLPTEWTLLFEIIYPDNRVVVDYGDKEQLVLLAIRDRFTDNYEDWATVQAVATKWGFGCPMSFWADVDDIAARCQDMGLSGEGFVAEFTDGSRFKFKSPKYLELHKVLSGLSFKRVLEAIQNGTINELKAIIPDEFIGDVERWQSQITDELDHMLSRIIEAYTMAPDKYNRKNFALWVQAEHKRLAPYLFAMLDDKDLLPIIFAKHNWDMVENGPVI
jgi:RNA ligase